MIESAAGLSGFRQHVSGGDRNGSFSILNCVTPRSGVDRLIDRAGTTV
jgi:hypothetical protein